MDDQRMPHKDRDDVSKGADEPYLAGAVEVEGDLVEVAKGVWAIHGRWPYDGDVILAEYTSVTEAHVVLDHLPIHPASETDVGVD
jgi:hypothetical protein